MTPPETITSLQNARIKAIRALAERGERAAAGRFVAEGVANFDSARRAGWTPVSVVHQADGLDPSEAELLTWASSAGADLLPATPAVLVKLTGRTNPPRLLGVFPRRSEPLPAKAEVRPDALWLALEGVRDPGNLGTIVRTADAFGVAGVILVGACVDPTAPVAVQAAMGSLFQVRLTVATDAGFADWLTAWQGAVVGTHLAAAHDIRQLKPSGPVLLLMGSEGAGLSQQLMARCTILTRIPQRAEVDSLNLAIATGIALYALRAARL